MTEKRQFLTPDPYVAAIDWNVLEAFQVLRKPGGPDPRVRLITIFLTSSSGLMDALRTALRKSDPEALSKAAHSMKSGSMNVGATGLGKLCAELEKIGRNGTTKNADKLFAAAESQYAAVADAFKQIVSENNN
ncbi:MAG: Hpt domain-containing protein [Geobacteraceae bacterium]|nr:Hpt domain-containing protein [Geobacteraceae bacterium]